MGRGSSEGRVSDYYKKKKQSKKHGHSGRRQLTPAAAERRKIMKTVEREARTNSNPARG